MLFLLFSHYLSKSDFSSSRSMSSRIGSRGSPEGSYFFEGESNLEEGLIDNLISSFLSFSADLSLFSYSS